MSEALAIEKSVSVETLTDIDKAAGLFSESDIPSGVKQPVSAAPQSPQVDQAMAGMLSGGLVVTFNLLAKKRGEHWAISAGEATEAGNAYALVIQKYFPAFNTGPEFAAIMITVAMIAPRVMMDKANEAAKAHGDGSQSE